MERQRALKHELDFNVYSMHYAIGFIVPLFPFYKGESEDFLLQFIGEHHGTTRVDEAT